MAKVCSICERGTTTGYLKSHSQRKTKRSIGINLQTKKINGKSVKICTRCIKKLAKPIKK
ncbi:MAG TPA: L28 family ribosomal protein [bacterium]|mgnify:CR=1 FL=1|nr:L28 family ribosomal protein [bacterium]